MRRLGVVLLLALVGCQRDEPVYDGEPLSHWVHEAKQVSFFSFWNSTKDERRARAFRKLKEIGEPAVPALVKLMRDEEIPVSGDAFNALANLGPRSAAAVPELVAMLKHASPQHRTRAAWVLGAIGPAAETAVPALVPLMDDEDERTREAAARALGAIGGAGHVVLERARASGNETRRQVATHGVTVQDMDAAQRVRFISEALADPSWQVRREAVALFDGARRNEVEGLGDLLVRALNDPDERVSEAAYRVFVGYLQHQRSTPRLLATVLNGSSGEARTEAAWRLGKAHLTPDGPPFHPNDIFVINALGNALSAAEPATRIYAARAMAQGEGSTRDQGVRSLRREIANVEPILAVRGARQLYAIARNAAEVRPYYEAGLQDTAKWNRVETMSAIMEMGPNAELFRRELQRLRDSDPDPEVRERAQRSLEWLDRRF